MPSRAEILKTIDGVYACRMRGDKPGVAAYFSPQATFRIAGDSGLMPKMASSGGHEAMPTIEGLIDDFQFQKMERLNAIVEGDQAAVHWKVILSHHGGAPITTEFCDFWTIGDDGKATSLLQFVDTALAASLTGA